MPELFVIEGGDACGKTTQANRLAEVLHTRVIGFPRRTKGSDSPIGRVIDKYLKGQRAFVAADPDPDNPRHATIYSDATDPLEDARVLQAMMTWDRYSCHDLWDAPEQRLILSRYTPSGLVMGHLDGIPLPELIQAHKGLPHARQAFLLDIPAELQAERMLGRGEGEDRYEMRDGLMKRLETTRQYYLDVWAKHGPVHWPRTDWVIIPAHLSIDATFEKILQYIPRLPRHLR